MKPPIVPPRLRPFSELAGLVRGVATLPRLALRTRPQDTAASVMVLPGYLTGDGSTLALRAYLARRGHRVTGWEQGRNRGDVRRLVWRIVDKVHARHRDEGRPLHLVGWSLGGVLARETAKEIPDAVAQVITMGSPIVGGPKYTVFAGATRRSGLDLDKFEQTVAQRNEIPVPVPVTAIYSKRDGIVAWRACIDPNPDNTVEYVEVKAGHAELAWNANIFEVIARRIGAPVSGAVG